MDTRELTIEQVDPRDEWAFGQWFAVHDAVAHHDRPDEPGWLAHEVRSAALEALGPDRDHDVQLLAARLDGRLVGVARLDLPQRDNLHLGELELAVLPAERRHGVGRALLVEVERRLRAEGRTTVHAYSDEPPGHPSAADQGAGPALGFARAQVEQRRDLDLPVEPARAAALTAACEPYAVGYELLTWRDAVPESVLDDLALLNQRMSTDVPLDDLALEEEDIDGARVRRQEELARRQDRALFGAGAVHLASGRLVAYTDMAVPLSRPERAYQWNTIVLTEHRGHRLGTLVKLACLQRLSAESPRTRFISTWNAAENEPMIRVNDALGARRNGGHLAWQKRLGA